MSLAAAKFFNSQMASTFFVTLWGRPHNFFCIDLATVLFILLVIQIGIK